MDRIKISDDKLKYLGLLAEKYPSQRALTREIININAILNLPKGTEHFMSDLHGEYEAFYHILNNCSGVVREKLELVLGDTLSRDEIKELCTLIYYPVEKLKLIKKEQGTDDAWYRATLEHMLELARALSSKYTRSKVRKAMPEDYAYIIDELLHAQKDEDNNQVRYHNVILDTVISIDADGFVISLAGLIKRLAVDRLHIVGDIFDRGEGADKILDLLMSHHSVDIEWGNHDILWMGAACGSEVCVAAAVRNCLHYGALRMLEGGYGVSLRPLVLYAERLFSDRTPTQAALAVITGIMLKLEGQLIRRNPGFDMDDRLLLDKADPKTQTVKTRDGVFGLGDDLFALLDTDDPCRLSAKEQEIIEELVSAFTGSARLQRHVRFLYENGGMYRVYNGNLLYHGCVPLGKDGSLLDVDVLGEKYSGKELFDACDAVARSAFLRTPKRQSELDFMWFLHCAQSSPLCGRTTKAFERAYIHDKSAWHEDKNPYYDLYHKKEICEMILSTFGLDPSASHIINGHTPVRTVKGELPIRAGGRLLVIDGGFCKNYHETTGIAGYTLIYNSHGLRLKAHRPFESTEAALCENRDIHSSSEIIETEQRRVMVYATDPGEELQSKIGDLCLLLDMYRSGVIRPRE